MENLEIKTETVQIKNQELLIDAYLAYPVLPEKRSAIIVVQEIFGVNDHIQDVTRRIANEGYIAIAPAIYQRQAPGFTAGYTPEDVKIGKEYKNQTQAIELISDLQATIDYLYSLPQVKTTGVGTIGFCFGGHVTYLTAILPEIKATASFYGAGITSWTPGDGEATLKRTRDISGTIHLFFGLEDASIPVEQVDEIASELEKYQIPHQIWRYPGADHGFFCDQRASYNQQAAQDAWQKVLQLYKIVLI
ncbi:dienelactone hydrolase family protein [Gloeocapsa sp. PCC 73106]|uniref:dienelactone hydrolase family protein n=1 Tax=Gloeocapsa sp. PCC 73106 TaxID=102232 RepID=UPI0002ABB69E|nr:dienelactone hydrolase family protein [Gloeocapsa sp. PCC 73106]ELR98948.1 dienelactone hydrolase-like enzyme [Gloeocapsa sp. PCC 73106]